MLNWNRLPTLSSLRAFDATARGGSFSAAARSLNVTHSAVAQQVRTLEEFLSVELVTRGARGVELTAEGRSLADRLAVAFLAISDGIEEIQAAEKQRAVRVTTTYYFAESVLFPRLGSFWRDHPGVEVSFTPSDKALDLVAGGFDLAVRALDSSVKPEKWSGLEWEHILDTQSIAIASAKHVDNPETDWGALPWLIPDDDAWERATLRQAGIDIDNLKTIDHGDPAAEMRATEEGLGLSLANELVVRPLLDQGKVKIAPIPIDRAASYYFVWPPRPIRSGARKFMNWLKSAVRDD